MTARRLFLLLTMLVTTIVVPASAQQSLRSPDVIFVPTPQEVVDAACAAMNERTRLFFFSHVLSPTGMILPAGALCAAAR